MKVSIDANAGFCFGVKRAIGIVEKELQHYGNLVSLGEIVHNPEEIRRLEKSGLKTIGHQDLSEIKNHRVFIRAHGEPPSTYKKAQNLNLEIIDGTCPVVLKLQQRVKKAYEALDESGGTVVIAGRKNHPEVSGLIGQTENTAVVVENDSDIDAIDFTKPIQLFAQTTVSTVGFNHIVRQIQSRLKSAGSSEELLKVNKTLCGEVTHRVPQLIEFCKQNDVIVFVSGKNSSNGKFLFGVCKQANPESHHISAPEEISQAWFNRVETVGISGATSTPNWLMQEVATKITAI